MHHPFPNCDHLDHHHVSLPMISINEHFQVNLYSVETGKKEHELDTKGVNLHLDLDSAP